MDQTPDRGYPFPECEPPLIKDASDIEQMRDLAVAIDADVQGLYNSASDLLVHPDVCRMQTGTVGPFTGQQVDVFFDAFNFDNTPGQAMSDTAAGGLRILEAGWYLIGGWTSALTTTTLALRQQFLANGAPRSNYQGSAGQAISGEQFFSSEEVLVLNANDLVTMRLRHGALSSTSWSYFSRIWAFQLFRT